MPSIDTQIERLLAQLETANKDDTKLIHQKLKVLGFQPQQQS